MYTPSASFRGPPRIVGRDRTCQDAARVVPFGDYGARCKDFQRIGLTSILACRSAQCDARKMRLKYYGGRRCGVKITTDNRHDRARWTIYRLSVCGFQVLQSRNQSGWLLCNPCFLHLGNTSALDNDQDRGCGSLIA